MIGLTKYFGQKREAGLGLVEVLMAAAMLAGVALVATNVTVDMGNRQKHSQAVDSRQKVFNYYYDVSRLATARTNTESANADLAAHVSNATPVANGTRRCLELRDQTNSIVLTDSVTATDTDPCTGYGKYLDERGGTSCTGGACSSSNARFHVYAVWVARTNRTYEIDIIVQTINTSAKAVRLKDLNSLTAGTSGSELWTLGTGGTIYRDAGTGAYFGMSTSNPGAKLEVIGDLMVSSSSGSGGNKLIINSSGNVGIGTTGPGQKLTVAGMIESTSGGFKFPDGTTQSTAAAAGAWATKTTTYTAVSGDQLFASTSAGAFTITLPAAPSTGTKVTIIDLAGTFGTNNLTIGRNGNRIMGLAEDMTVSTSNAAFELVYSGSSTYGWRIK